MLECSLHQILHAIAVCRGDQQWLAKPKLVNLGGRLLGKPLRLLTASTIGRLAMRSRLAMRASCPWAFAGVKHKDHNVALGNCLLGLRRHLAHDSFGIDRLEAARVDHDVVARPDAASP